MNVAGGEFVALDQFAVQVSGVDDPRIVTLADGRFLVAYKLGSGIKAWVFDRDGSRSGDWITIANDGNPAQITLLALPNGGFVASWSALHSTGPDSSSFSVWARVFNSSAHSTGAAFLVNTNTFASQQQPTIAPLADGGFMIAWTDQYSDGTPGLSTAHDEGVRAQRFDSTGSKIGTEIKVNADPAYAQFHPVSIGLANGEVLMSWSSSFSGVIGQFYSSAGEKKGGEFQVSPAAVASLAPLPSGGFVVVYSAGEVMAQVYAADGTKIGSAFQVNTITAGDQYMARVAVLPSGGFLVTWYDSGGGSAHTGVGDIKAQLFDASGTKVGSEFTVNVATAGGQWEPEIATFGSDDVAIVWLDWNAPYPAPQLQARLLFSTESGTDTSDHLAGTPDRDFFFGLGGDDRLSGGAAADKLDGGTGSDFLSGDAGDDILDGGLGPDTMVGGTGNDTYIVDNTGDVVVEAAGEGTDTVKTSVGSKTDYTQMYVLPAFVENMFGTAAAAQGVYGNSLDNVITMGDGGDLIVLHDGGNDTVNSGGGNDFIYYGAAFTNADRNNGGAGTDTVGLLGSYTITFDADDLVSIEKLAAYSAGDTTGAVANNYNFTMIDANVAAGAQLMVIAQSLLAHETLTFNGQAETNGKFNVRGGRGNDTIAGGLGNDQIWGNLGADVLKGGGGNDSFEYHSVDDSAGASRDTILDFFAGDKINLTWIDADGDAVNGDSRFSFIGANEFGGVAGQLRITGSGSTWLVEADINGDGVADLVIDVTTIGGHALAGADFWM